MLILDIQSKKYKNVILIELQRVQLLSNFLYKVMQIYGNLKFKNNFS